MLMEIRCNTSAELSIAGWWRSGGFVELLVAAEELLAALVVALAVLLALP